MAMYEFADVADVVHRLRVEPTGFEMEERLLWAIELTAGDQVIFGDGVIGGPPSADVNSAASAALTFLTALPRDVGEDYFSDYTPEQIAWRDTHAEDLATVLVGEGGEELASVERYRVDDPEDDAPFAVIAAVVLTPEEIAAL